MVNLSTGNNNGKKESWRDRFKDWLKFTSQKNASLAELLIITVLVLVLIMALGFAIWYGLFNDGGIPCRSILCWIGAESP